MDLKQQELTEAGLSATQEQYAELEALKQQVAIADARKTIDPTTLATEELKRKAAYLEANREKAVAERQFAAESELADMRLEIERLKARWEMEHPGGV